MYVLDGYNILFQKKLKEVPLEELRAELLKDLNTLAQHLHVEIVVIFDAHHTKDAFHRERFHSLDIVFTNLNQTADDFIIEYASCLPKQERGQITVVSSDGHIRRSVRSEQIRVLSVHHFFAELSKKLTSLQKKTSPENDIKSSIPSLMDVETWEKLFSAKP